MDMIIGLSSLRELKEFSLVGATAVFGGWVLVVSSLLYLLLSVFLGEACNIFYGVRWARLIVFLLLSWNRGCGVLG